MIVCGSRCADVWVHVCILIPVYFHVSAGACTHTYVCIEKSLIWGVFLSYCPPQFLREGLLLNLELTKSAVLAGQQASGILASLHSQN